MSSIVIARMEETNKVLLVYDIEDKKVGMVRRHQLSNINCINYTRHSKDVVYTQGETENRIPLKSELDKGHYCYILYKVVDSRGKTVGYDVLDIDGVIELKTLTYRQTVALMASCVKCVNAKVVQSNNKVLISTLRGTFKNRVIVSEATPVSRESIFKQKMNQVTSLSGDELCTEYEKLQGESSNSTDKNKLDIIKKRLNKKTGISKALKTAMVLTVTTLMLGGTLASSNTLLNRDTGTKTVSVTSTRSGRTEAPKDFESTKIRLLNATDITTVFNGDTGDIMVDGIKVANIESVFESGTEKVEISDLEGNVLATNKNEFNLGSERNTYITEQSRLTKRFSIDSKYTNGISRKTVVKGTDGQEVLKVSVSKFTSGMRYKLVDKNDNTVYRFSGSNSDNKGFRIQKDNIKSDVSMIDALLVAATHNTHIDELN